MKKFTLYILTAFGLMGLATSCNDFGDLIDKFQIKKSMIENGIWIVKLPRK